MPIRRPSLALLAAASMCLAACDAPSSALPTEGTVRLTVVANADHGGRPFRQTMTQEVTTTPVWSGDPDGVGEALLTINAGQREVCWDVSVTRIALPATASHIHEGPAGVRGPIVIPLSSPDATGHATGCATGLDRELLQRILAEPASFYVNVHTSEFPAGAIRSQLDR
jgi:hypothetical protein